MPSTYTDGLFSKNDLLTVREVADHLRVSRVTVWRWCQQGVIPAIRIGRMWRISRHSLLSDLEAPRAGELSESASSLAERRASDRDRRGR